MSYFDTDKVRQSAFIGIILALGYILFRELQVFIPAFLGAFTLYVLMQKYQVSLVQKRKWKPAAAAGILMLLSFLIILIPIMLVINLLSSKVGFAVEHSGEVMEAVKVFLKKIEQQVGMDLVSGDNIQKVGGQVAGMLPSVVGATFNTLTTLIMMYFMLFFMLTSGKKMQSIVYQLTPIEDDDMDRVNKEVNNIVVSNAVGIPLIAILQGIVGLIGYLIIGVKEPMLWFTITCITAMLPVVGAAIAYVPLAIIFFAQGDTWKGIFMVVYGFGVIGTVDNVFRFTLAKKIGDIHPLITIFGVIIGIDLFGFIGLIFGPLLISLFILLVRIYLKEFHVKWKSGAQKNISENT